MTRFFSLFLFISLFVSVNSQNLYYTTENVSKVLNSDKYKRDSVYLINISWPVFDETKGKTFLAEKLNKFVRNQISGDTMSVAKMVEYMIATYKEFETEETMGMYWNYECSIFVTETGNQVVSLHKSEYDYSGGAHGNGFLGYYNFDLNNSEILMLSDLIEPGSYEKVTKVAEKIFREVTEVGDRDLNEAGYWFEESKFHLNENFLITEKGLTFFYNSYEIAPYAGGPTELEIPYSAIKDFIKKDGPLKFLF